VWQFVLTYVPRVDDASPINRYKWLTAVGWDCMILKNNEVVFFEGNFAGARTPRRMFMSFEHFWAFTTNLFWPFGHGNSARPGAQAFA
jgi:hypothetical protein